jgi:hypothetical protein
LATSNPSIGLLEDAQGIIFRAMESQMAKNIHRWHCLIKFVPVALAVHLGSLVLGYGRARAELVTGLSTTGNLVTFDSTTPGTIDTTVAITGLESGETMLGIDRRPSNGLLYGLGSTSRLYSINTTTGLATAVGASPFAPVLTGTAFGFDFNPVPDRIRVVSTDTTNFRLNPNTGALAGTDTPLSYAAGDTGVGITPRIVGSAYTNNVSGTSATTLFGIDSNRDVLVMQGGPSGSPSPNGGVLTTIGGGLGVDTSDLVGFDISGITGVAYASLTPPTGGASQLFTIDLTTGTATLVGSIGGGVTLADLAVGVGTASVPEPTSFTLLALGSVGLFTVVRRTRTRKS